MSGHKHTTVSLSHEEYRRLHEAEMRRRFLNESTPGQESNAPRGMQTTMRSNVIDTHFRQQLLIETLQEVNNEISSLEERSCQALIDQEVALTQAVDSAMDYQQSMTEAVLSDLELHVQQRLQEVLARHQQDRSYIESEWQRMATSHNAKLVLAREWLQAATALDEFILEHYDHDHLTPGQLARIEQRLIQAQHNLAHNMPEAALTAAQEAYNQFSDLRITLEKLNSEYRILFQRVSDQIQLIRQLFSQNKIVPAIDLEGNPLPYKIDVDHWSLGFRTKLEQDFERTIQEQLNGQQYTSVDVLRSLLDEYFPGVGVKLSEIVFDVRMKVINAQLRVNIADIVVEAISTQGYRLEESAFENGDERTTFQATLSNYEGSQVIVRIDPIPGETVSNELHLITSDTEVKTQHEQRQRALEIRRVLEASGLHVGIITAAPLATGSEVAQQPFLSPESQLYPRDPRAIVRKTNLSSR